MQTAVISPPASFLTAEWRDLVMLNFEVSPEVVERYLTPGLEVDTFDGKTYLSVVGFRFLKTRVFGVAIPFHRVFDEVNLRFYVKRTVDGETRRGVMFIKELVPRRMVAWVARTFYNENYQTAPMWSTITHPDGQRPGRACYEWQVFGRRCSVSAEFENGPKLPEPGSLAQFIVEHYWGYSRQRDGGTLEYAVEHPPWRVWPASAARLDCDPAMLYGLDFARYLECNPASALVAEGSAIVVRRGTRVQLA